MDSSKRSLLKAAALTTGLLTVSRVTWAKLPTEKRFITVVLRGGLDGLGAVIPYADRDYKKIRSSLALSMDGNNARDLNGYFALHSALDPLFSRFEAREMAVINAVASPYRERSHFDAQKVLENGYTSAGRTRSGWMNRALTILNEKAQIGGIAIAPSTPLILRGDTAVSSWTPSNLPEIDEDFLSRVSRMYEEDAMLHPVLSESFDQKMMQEAQQGGGGNFTALMNSLGSFLKQKDGPRVATIDIGGWDTHSGQGTTDGRLPNLLSRFASGVEALRQQLGGLWEDTVIVAVTEFGRTVRVNGTSGTDHGTASVAFAIGGALKRGRGGYVLGQWPTLRRSSLFEGRDLRPTVDMRAIFINLLRGHYGIGMHEIHTQIFPGTTKLTPIEIL